MGYNGTMAAKLTKKLAAALHAAGYTELEVIDPDTERTYFLVDSDIHLRAMEALRRQQDHDAIGEGIAQMEGGEGKPLDQAFYEMRARLGFPLSQ